MIGYFLFLIPMLIAFTWISHTKGIKQALFDLLAFNLLFDFDFAGILPGNFNIKVIDVIIFTILGIKIFIILTKQKIVYTKKTTGIILILIAFVLWLGFNIITNNSENIGPVRAINYFFRVFLISILYFFIGMQFNKCIFSRFVSVLIFAATISAIITTTQTISNGTLLWHGASGERYLGIFQPRGEKNIARSKEFETEVNQTENIRTIRFGSLAFLRGPGTHDGSYIIVLVVLGWSFYFLLSQNRSLWMYIVLLITAGCIIIQFSRTAIIAILCVVFICFFLIRKKHLISHSIFRMFIIAFMLIPVIIFFQDPISVVINANIDRFFGSSSKEVETFHGRTSLWDYVFSEIQKHPITGTGEPITGMRVGWFNNDNPNVGLSAHNIFLEFGYRAGIPSALLFAFLYLSVLWKTFVIARNSVIPAIERTQGILIFIALISILITNLMASYIATSPQLSALFWLLSGYGSILWARTRATDENQIKRTTIPTLIT